MEILELKYNVYREGVKRLDAVEKKINEFENIAIKTMQSEVHTANIFCICILVVCRSGGR